MKIALIGYGKLGKAIEAIALERGHEIALRVTRANAETYDVTGCDVAIECTNPEAAVGNITRCLNARVPVVVGTTGWYHELDRMKQLSESQHTSMLCATNFSIGVHIFWETNKVLAKLMYKIKGYDVKITETHHVHKKDAPSGTAITTAELIMQEQPMKKSWVLKEGDRVPDESELMIEALREGEAKGTHVVTYTSAVDFIELKHEAFNRNGFASGAVLAAEFLIDKKGVFTMQDVIENILK